MMQTYNQKQRRIKRRNKNVAIDVVGDIAWPVAKWAGKQALQGAKGLVSAYMRSGGSKVDMVKAVAPLAASISQTSKAPKFQNVSGGVKLQHTEAVAIYNTSNALVISSDTFQWLSTISNGFEEYKIKCEFGYVPICPATTVGTTMLAWDYDPSDSQPYLGYEDFFNTADHCIGAIWTPSAIAPSESKWLKTGQEGDARLWSPGVLKVNTTDPLQGYYMVRYTVELRMAQPPTAGYALYTGVYTSKTALFAGAVFNSGAPNQVVISDTTVTQNQPGRYLYVWSTSGNTGTLSPSGGSLAMGGVNNGVRSMHTFYTNALGNISGLQAANDPSVATAWQLAIYKIVVSPVIV